jgi:hypothetical protein
MLLYVVYTIHKLSLELDISVPRSVHIITICHIDMFFVPFTICHIDSPLSIATTVPILYFLQKYLL